MEKRILVFALSLCLILHGIPVYAAEGAGGAVSRQGVESFEATEYVIMNGKAFLRASGEAPAELPGVDVMWVNKANGVAYYSRTGNNGQYSIQIPQGTYLVQCTYGDQCETWEVNTNSEIPEEKITNVMFDRYPEPAGGNTVQGDVIELRGEPVASAAVMLEEQNGGNKGRKYVTSTDVLGRYSFEHVAVGTYELTVIKGRIEYKTNGWVVDRGPLIFYLPRVSAVVSGYVIGLNGDPVPGASVRLYDDNSGDGSFKAATADANGRYSIAQIGYGSYTLLANDSNGFMSGSAQLRLSNQSTLMGDVDIQLNPGDNPDGFIAGTVKKQDGTFFSGGEVTVASTSDSTFHTAFLRSDGTYSVQNLPDGEYRITIHTGNCVASKVVTIQGGILTGNADFILSDSTLQGHIIMSDGGSQTGSIVTLTGTDGMVFESLPVSDSGQFSVVNLPEGQYQVTLTVPGQESVNAGSLEIQDGQIHQADVIYSSTGGAGLVNSEMFTVVGGVSDEGVAVAGAAILVRDENGGEVAAAQTDNNGRYIIPNLPNGTYSIYVTTADGKTGQSTITILNGIITNGGGAIVVSPEGGGEITPPDEGGTTPPDGGGTTPPDGGGTTPPDGGGTTPPDGGGTTPPDEGGTTPPDGGGTTPPDEGGTTPPDGGGTTPPDGGGTTPPDEGGITPPDGGGTTPPDEGGTTPPDGGGTTPPDGGGTTPPDEGGTTPPDGGGTTPPDEGGTTPPDGGGTTPPDGGGTTPPDGGGTTPPDGGGSTPPDEGGTTPPDEGGTTPPDGGGTTPPDGGGTTPPDEGGITPPDGGGTTPPDGGGTTPPDGGGTTPPDGGGTTPPDGGGTPPDGSVSGGDKDSNGNSPADNNNKPDGNQNPSEGGSSNGGSNPSEGGSPNGGGNPTEGGSSQPGGGNTGAEGDSNAAANTAAYGNAGKKISNSGVSGKEAVTVRGRVDAANAEVTIRDTANPDLVYSVKTDPQGFYRIEGLPDGTYKIMITASDGKEATAEFVVKNGESTLKAADFEGAVAVSEVEVFEGSGRTKSGSEPRTGDRLPPVVPVAMIGGLAYLMDLFCDKKGVRMGMKKARKDWLIEKIVSRARGKAKPVRILALSLIFVILVFYHSIGKVPEFDAGGLAHA